MLGRDVMSPKKDDKPGSGKGPNKDETAARDAMWISEAHTRGHHIFLTFCENVVHKPWETCDGRGGELVPL